MTQPQMTVENGELHFQGKKLGEQYFDPNQFTYAAYRAQVKQALEAGYEFISFDDGITSLDSNTIILRHDEPFSLEASLAVAKINAELGVAGTFFINPDNEYYDLSQESAQKMVEEIASLGQNIGLQIIPKDEKGEALSIAEMTEKAEDSKNSLEAIIGKPVTAVAFDKTGIDVPEDDQIAGMWNVYGHKFADGIDRSKSYNSNSNGMNLFQSNLPQFIQDGKSHIHWLVHPCWLSEKPMLPYDRLKSHDIDLESPAFKSYMDAVHKGRVIAGDNFAPEIDRVVQIVMEENRSVTATSKPDTTPKSAP